MLTANQLRRVAGRSGARDIGNVEIDVILTYLLQLFAEKGIMDHVGFKGGTMLRKMVFGPRGRLSTDLDFTSHSDIDAEDLMLMMLDALDRPYHGISFRFDREKDWYLTDDGCAANPVCAHAENEKGVKIKLQVSMRERPVLPIRPMPQIALDYFNLLEFVPVAVPCLAFEEVVAEKIRAAAQRSKVRDLHDLSEIAVRVLNRDIIRSLVVLKLWDSDGPNLDYGGFRARITGAGDYDVADLTTLLRREPEARPRPDDPACRRWLQVSRGLDRSRKKSCRGRCPAQARRCRGTPCRREGKSRRSLARAGAAARNGPVLRVGSSFSFRILKTG